MRGERDNMGRGAARRSPVLWHVLVGVVLAATPLWAAPGASSSDASSDALRRLAQRLATRPANPVEADPIVQPRSDAATVRTVAPAVILAEPAATEKLPLGLQQLARRQADDANISHGNAGWILQTLSALGVVIGLILLLRTVAQRAGGISLTPRRSPAVEVLARVPVAPRSHLLLVRLGQRVLVLGDSAGGLRTLADLEDPQEVADLLGQLTAHTPHSATRQFDASLARAEALHDDARIIEEGADQQEHLFDRARHELSGMIQRLRQMTGGGGAA